MINYNYSLFILSEGNECCEEEIVRPILWIVNSYSNSPFFPCDLVSTRGFLAIDRFLPQITIYRSIACHLLDLKPELHKSKSPSSTPPRLIIGGSSLR
jgi:hypothetical protein